mmetsp:Transcript_9757/g.17608  ORF Transcript_9757/g.17608 Transcript_9757/m.17608 type:complete len:262 (-) Transcript_9757:47-832(-)
MPQVHSLQVATWAAIVAIACVLQGCDVPRLEGYVSISDASIGIHEVSNWRSAPNYFESQAFQDPLTGQVGFNSCMNPNTDAMHVCSGRGSCKAFDPDDTSSPVFFCDCEQGYGGPECGTVRKRQSTAWLISLLFGYTGADELYLQWWLPAACKFMLTVIAVLLWAIAGASKLGATLFGAPWVFDLVRIGSAPVRAANYRVEADLPAFNFAVLTVVFFAFVGYVFGMRAMYKAVLQRKYKAGRDLTYGSASSHFLAKEVPPI